MRPRTLLTAAVCVLSLCPALPSVAKTPVWLDLNVGTGMDAPFALAYALTSPEVDLKGISTVGPGAEDRAWIVCRFLTHVDRRDVPVVWGRDKTDGVGPIDWQIQYRRHPAVVWNRTVKPSKTPAVEAMAEALKGSPDGITIVTTGPLTNVAALLAKEPGAKARINRVVALRAGIATDQAAARAVAEAKVRVDPVEAAGGLDGTLDVTTIFAAQNALTYQLQSLHELWDSREPVSIVGPLAVAMAAEAGDRIEHGQFKRRVIERLSAFGPVVPFRAPVNPSKLVDRGNLPARVHVFEDYETDIEKRWWMTGKLETADVAPGRGRACRAVLTQDYDDRMGDAKAVYRAVIFNPVPGPPMGANSRLSFRYKLKGTDTIRVQLFSLSNGYHRYLSVSGLPQGEWREAAVDMTQMRRPDGSGGALAADERIDDIQFYVEPQAELLIDDIVLYELSAKDEARPFPKEFAFTGWFDTGKQGVEWPGTFEIVPHEKPRMWKAAKSTADGALRVNLRGPRPWGQAMRMNFRYKLTGAPAGAALGVSLVNSQAKARAEATVKDLKVGEWAEGAVDFAAGMAKADEVAFDVPKGATLWVDDVLLYEPGESR